MGSLQGTADDRSWPTRTLLVYWPIRHCLARAGLALLDLLTFGEPGRCVCVFGFCRLPQMFRERINCRWSRNGGRIWYPDDGLLIGLRENCNSSEDGDRPRASVVGVKQYVVVTKFEVFYILHGTSKRSIFVYTVRASALYISYGKPNSHQSS